MSKPIIAVVGRPNVGKSTLFNRLIGERRSIVEDTPGVTRDRIYGETEWRGQKLILIDTGGIEPKTNSIILKQMRLQAEIAIETADVIIFMCDVRTGLTADDREIAVMLKKSGKPIVLAVNKADKVGDLPYEFYEFYELGFEREPIALSSLHGSGSGDILDAVLEAFPPEAPEDFVRLCADYVINGRNRAQLLNDEAVMKALVHNGVSGNDAADYYCGGCMEALRRVSAGEYTIDEAVPLGTLLETVDPQQYLRDVDTMFRSYPAVTLTSNQEKRCRNGNSFSLSLSDGTYRAYGRSGEFLMLAKVEDGIMSTTKSFFEV